MLVALGEDPASVMSQLGHTDAGFTLSVYARAMRRKDGEKEALRALVEGRSGQVMDKLRLPAASSALGERGL